MLPRNPDHPRETSTQQGPHSCYLMLHLTLSTHLPDMGELYIFDACSDDARSGREAAGQQDVASELVGAHLLAVATVEARLDRELACGRGRGGGGC